MDRAKPRWEDLTSGQKIGVLFLGGFGLITLGVLMLVGIPFLILVGALIYSALS